MGTLSDKTYSKSFLGRPLRKVEGSKTERPLATALWNALRGLSVVGGTAREAAYEKMTCQGLLVASIS